MTSCGGLIMYFLLPYLLLQEMGPEFIRMVDEPAIVLELPGSIVVSS